MAIAKHHQPNHATRLISAGLLLLLCCSVPARLLAQQPDTDTLHINARIVLLDVVVTDKNGHPVDGLKKEDFAVFEDKQPQRIVSFELPSAHQLSASTASMPFNPADTKSFGQSPVTILVLDELNTHFADADFARRSVRQFIASQPATLAQPTTLLVVSNSHFQLVQDFTRDRESLLNALAKHVAQYPWKLEQSKSIGQGTVERLDQSISALEQIAQSTARIPGRKNLVWVGQGFPSLDPDSLSPDLRDLMTNTLQHVTDTFLATRITLYAVDPTSTAAGMTEITDQTQLEFSQLAGEAAGRNIDPFNSELDFDRFGPITGGRVIRGLNDVDKQISASIDLGGQFYTIGYAPSSTSEAAKSFRHITVKCLIPGLTAVSRDGYYPAAPERERSRDIISYDLNNAATAEIPLTALQVTITRQPRPAKTSTGIDTQDNLTSSTPPTAYIVHVAAPGLEWHDADTTPSQTPTDADAHHRSLAPHPAAAQPGEHTAQVQVLVVSLSSKNKVLAHTLHTMTATAKSTADLHSPALLADFATTAESPRGTTHLRFVVRDTTTGQMGTADLPIP
jgi:VWFA-related protein